MQATKNILAAIWHAVKWFYALPREHKGYIIILTYIAVLVSIIVLRDMAKPIEYERVLSVEEAHAKESETVLIEEVIDWNDKERVKQEIRKVFPENAETMIAIAQCESGLIPTAKGPTSDHGIFQLHMPSHRKEIEKQGIDVNDPADNIRFARYLYDHGGLSHWRASRNCWSK